jgi:hypothetical protein
MKGGEAMGKRMHHMGMILTKEEHDRWHKEAPVLSPKRHDALMKKLGVTKEQDEEWHRSHQTLQGQRISGRKAVNPFALGGGFLAWCVKQGWLIQEGKEYFATKEGQRELRERFGLRV